MRYSSKTFISLSLMVIASAVAITALEWPFRSALFPLIVGISVFVMAIAETVLGLFDEREGAGKAGALTTTLSEDVDPKTAFWRTLNIFAWTFGFFLMIFFFGFPIAVPLLVFLYLKCQGKEGWGITLMLTGATIVFFYGLFIWFLETTFPEGWIFRGLRMIGIG